MCRRRFSEALNGVRDKIFLQRIRHLLEKPALGHRGGRQRLYPRRTIKIHVEKEIKNNYFAEHVDMLNHNNPNPNPNPIRIPSLNTKFNNEK